MLVWLTAVAFGCVQGPFTEPAKVVLYEDRNKQSAAPDAVVARKQAPRPRSHVVRDGETVYAVANRYRVPVRSLIEHNALRAPYALRPGQRLQLPTPRRHLVQAGDTVYGIARRYGISISSLVRLNKIEPPYTIVTGRSLRLPVELQTAAAEPRRVAASQKTVSAQLPPRARPDAPRRQSSAIAPSRKPTASRKATQTPPAAPRIRASVPKPPPRVKKVFLLPVRGRVISGFGPQGKGLRNDGINIAVAQGTPVRAAENGIVVYSGNALLGFGNMVLIRHADGFMTAYGHNHSLKVARGDVVRRGQVIAEAGSTGNVSTPQLHFEIRKGKKAVNPAKYLPSLAAHKTPIRYSMRLPSRPAKS